jgi:hypothetical protein
LFPVDFALRVILLPRALCPLLQDNSYTLCVLPEFRATCVAVVLRPSVDVILREFVAMQDPGPGPASELPLPVDDSNPLTASVLVSPRKGMLALTRRQLAWLAPTASTELETVVAHSPASLQLGSASVAPVLAVVLLQCSSAGLWVSVRTAVGLDAALSRTFRGGDAGNVYVHADNSSLVAELHTGDTFRYGVSDSTFMSVEVLSIHAERGANLILRRCVNTAPGVQQVALAMARVVEYPPRNVSALITLEAVDRREDCPGPGPGVGDLVARAVGGDSVCVELHMQLSGNGSAGLLHLPTGRVLVIMSSSGSETGSGSSAYGLGDRTSPSPHPPDSVLDPVSAAVSHYSYTHCGRPGEYVVGSVWGDTGTRLLVTSTSTVIVDVEVKDQKLGFRVFRFEHTLTWVFALGRRPYAQVQVSSSTPNGVYTYDVLAKDFRTQVQVVVDRLAPSSSPSSSASSTKTLTASRTSRVSLSTSPTTSLTETHTPTRTPSGTKTFTRTPSRTKSSTRTPSRTKTLTRTPSGTKSSTRTPSGTKTFTRTPSRTKTLTRTLSTTKSFTKTSTKTHVQPTPRASDVQTSTRPRRLGQTRYLQ